jgi:hypothetical protein
MERRWAQHVCQAKSTRGGRWHFPNAIRKYGPEAFEHEVLEVCETLEEANAAEQKWIEFYDTRNPEFGFNLAKGEQHKPHPVRKNPWDDPEYRAKQMTIDRSHLHTQEARAANKAALGTSESKVKRAEASREVCARPDVLTKMSQAAKERVYTPEVRQHMSEAAKHRKTTIRKNSGWPALARERAAQAGRDRTWTTEMRAKISAANLGKRLSDDHKAKIASARAEREKTVRREHHLRQARLLLIKLLRFIGVDDIQAILIELQV